MYLRAPSAWIYSGDDRPLLAGAALAASKRLRTLGVFKRDSSVGKPTGMPGLEAFPEANQGRNTSLYRPSLMEPLGSRCSELKEPQSLVPWFMCRKSLPGSHIPYHTPSGSRQVSAGMFIDQTSPNRCCLKLGSLTPKVAATAPISRAFATPISYTSEDMITEPPVSTVGPNSANANGDEDWLKVRSLRQSPPEAAHIQQTPARRFVWLRSLCTRRSWP